VADADSDGVVASPVGSDAVGRVVSDPLGGPVGVAAALAPGDAFVSSGPAGPAGPAVPAVVGARVPDGVAVGG
jgi:hypothetical protein